MLVSYDMNRLQRLAEPDDYVVTLNGADRVDQRSVIATMHYEHPIYTPESVAARRRLPELNDGTLAFAGAYHGWGFHEDGCAAGRARGGVAGGGVVTVARSGHAALRDARLYDVEVRHVRRARCTATSATASTCGWSTSTRCRGSRRGCGRSPGSRPADHLGDPRGTIRGNLDRWLADHGIDLHGGRVLMLANARVLGHVFNPLTVYWCHRPDGTLACVVAEVHNTYGERHCYLLRPDAAGRARGREGVLRLAVPARRRRVPHARCPVPGERLALAITLRQDGRTALAATVAGVRRPATPRALVRMLLRRPLVTLRTSALIRRHGIALWLRRLPVIPRPRHAPQEGVQ